MTAVLDPNVLTGFHPGAFRYSSEDGRFYLLTDDGAIPADGPRGLTVLDANQMTGIGSDHFTLRNGLVDMERPVSPIAVGDTAFDGQVMGNFFAGAANIAGASGFSATRQRLNLNFLSGGSLDPRITTSGGTNGTRVNSAGLIVPATTPRFDYDPVTLAPKGLLIEEARTNLLTGSADFTATYWTEAMEITVAADNAVSPDGGTNADKLTDITTSGVRHRLLRNYTFTAAAHTLSAYVKRIDHRWVRLFFYDGATNFFANFDLLNGVVGSKHASATSTITSVGSGWFRITLTATAAAAAGNIQIVMMDSDDAGSPVLYTGAGTSLMIWGAQLEAGSFATSYIPTTSATVTRAADVASMTGTNFSSWYNASEGTFLVEYDTLFANTSPNSAYLAGLDNSSSKRLLYVSSGSNQLSSYDGATIISTPNVATGASAQKGGLAYSAAGRAICANGGAVTTGTGPFSGTSLNIGHSGGVNSFNGHFRRLFYYPQRVSNAQLPALTA